MIDLGLQRHPSRFGISVVQGLMTVPHFQRNKMLYRRPASKTLGPFLTSWRTSCRNVAVP